MNWSRRTFIKSSAAASVVSVLPSVLRDEKLTTVHILHTNDLHSRIDPFPMDGGKLAGLGGVARKAALIKRIREENDHVLLFDSGDIFQGTPYFNYFHGEPELKSMQAMGYDAVTMGNHDFDAGLENYEMQMRMHANFPLIISNYDFSATCMHDRFEKRKVFHKGNIKIGVTGVGIELEGLVSKNLYQETKYLDPIENASREALILKEEEKCDLVICLSHLGIAYDVKKVSDAVLAKESSHIDIILGGHTHTFMNGPKTYTNVKGRPVLVHQAGWGGVQVGHLEVNFERNKRHKCESCRGLWVLPANE